jgi:hypothetical protein
VYRAPVECLGETRDASSATQTIRVFIAPVPEPHLGPRLICRATNKPLLDSARILLAQGHKPTSSLEVWREGADGFALRAQLGVAAGLTVADPDKGVPHFQRWKRFPSSAIEAAVPLQVDPDDTFSSSPLRRQSSESTLKAATVETPRTRSSAYTQSKRESY